jgi:hypothetical protein
MHNSQQVSHTVTPIEGNHTELEDGAIARVNNDAGGKVAKLTFGHLSHHLNHYFGCVLETDLPDSSPQKYHPVRWIGYGWCMGKQASLLS